MFFVFIFIASILSSNAKENVTCGMVMDDGNGVYVSVISFSDEETKGCPNQITIKNVAKGLSKRYKLAKDKKLEVYLDQHISIGPCFYKLGEDTITCYREIFRGENAKP